MKIIGAAKITDIARNLSFMAMLAYLALLFIHFILSSLAVGVNYLMVKLQAIFHCPDARKRILNKIVHDRNYAVFTISPDSRAGLPGK